eukprot:6068967-Pyramimonas_sp.AAC.1
MLAAPNFNELGVTLGCKCARCAVEKSWQFADHGLREFRWREGSIDATGAESLPAILGTACCLTWLRKRASWRFIVIA